MTESFDVVTGGAGFIGSQLARTLLERGGTVRILDNLSTSDRSRVERLEAQYGPRLEFREHDICDLEATRDALAGVRHVFHQAAVPSVPRSVADPIGSNAANVDGTLNVLVAARDAGARKLVYASSSSVYGDSAELPKHEGLPTRPLSPYAVTKCVGELYAEVFSRLYELPTVGLRYFNVFGPSQDPNSQYAAVIPRFLTRMLAGESPSIYGDGEQSRDFTYIDNVVSANLLAAESAASGISVNVACGDRFTLNELLAALNEILGTQIEASCEPPRSGDVKHSQADISRAREQIGFEPKVGFHEGLRATTEWFKEQ
jgi:nucleoside-diphosphate-sugar epimerase